MRVTTKIAVLAAACVALSSSCVGADITFSTTDLSGAGNAGVGKTPCPSLPQGTNAAESTAIDTTPTDAPAAPAATEVPVPVVTDAPATEIPVATEEPAAAKTPCPSLPQPPLSSSSSGESSDTGDNSSSTSGKSPCPSLQTASTSSDGSVSAPCPSLKVKTPCPSLLTASKSSSKDADSGSSDAVEVAISGLTIAAVSASALLLL
ncbi:hypothetical protein PI124_g16168 [Phytophthora idaei]|nr:hypothetical protein PI125_g16355 [Phytophthora idaei]KAG3143208.1 hypothetical protein PI126_g14737 [Phytophthora idaei]KAG3238884.1 hypothetical protein PI124_g16168 [Phytophthora idaei]